METDIIQMRQGEIERLKVVHKVIGREITQGKAAEIVGLSVRQMQRMIKKVREEGDRGVIHGGRGKPSSRKISEERRRFIGGMIARKYPDFGPTMASEKLFEREGIRISRETLRQIMVGRGLWRVRRKKEGDIHLWRERKGHYGEMVQMDGSHHDWLEGRGPKMVMMGYVDDATGWFYGRFYKYEGVYPAMDSLKRYIQWFGIPMSIYLDKHSTYKTTRESDLDEELRGEQSQTQFERAARELGIRIIHAHSPQAKGRIERVFGTLQDRLIKEMRLAGIQTMGEANQYLARYLPIYNRQFAREALRSGDLHRQVSKGQNLKEIFCIKLKRAINNGYTMRWKGRLFAIENASVMMKGRKALVMEHFDGKIVARFNGREIKLREVTDQQLERKCSTRDQSYKPRRKSPPFPGPNHPWRRNDPALHHYVLRGM